MRVRLFFFSQPSSKILVPLLEAPIFTPPLQLLNSMCFDIHLVITRVEVFDLCFDRIRSNTRMLFDPKYSVENCPALSDEQNFEILAKTWSNYSQTLFRFMVEQNMVEILSNTKCGRNIVEQKVNYSAWSKHNRTQNVVEHSFEK